MSRMPELAAELSELRRCGETLISISKTLAELFSAGDGEPAAEQPVPEKTYKFTEVRAILAEKSRDGHTVAVKDLLHKYGADKLSDLDPKFYAAIVADVEVL